MLWKITEDDVIYENDSLFDEEIYNSYEFNNIIKDKKYYTIFCNIQLYKKDSKITDINSVEDFLNSDCELILLITDNIFAEVYSKKEEYKKQILRNLEEIGIKDIKEKDIYNRKTMFAHGD